MNANQLATLKNAIAQNRKQQISVLKELRAQGVEILVSLRACTRAIADEVARLVKLASASITKAVSVLTTDAKATLAFWAGKPVKSLNTRAVRGAIALSLKLGF